MYFRNTGANIYIVPGVAAKPNHMCSARLLLQPKLEKWDSDSDSDETDEEDLKV